jgi:hypothetical protein
MFSNLRTEGRPNHLFMPQLHLTSLQTDHVRILRSSHQGTADECAPIGPGLWCSYPGERVPYFELKRWLSRQRDLDGKPIRAELEHGGRRVAVAPGDGTELSRELYAEHPVLLAKLLAFRLVPDPNAPMACVW